jgi:hypothetical protein
MHVDTFMVLCGISSREIFVCTMHGHIQCVYPVLASSHYKQAAHRFASNTSDHIDNSEAILSLEVCNKSTGFYTYPQQYE